VTSLLAAVHRALGLAGSDPQKELAPLPSHNIVHSNGQLNAAITNQKQEREARPRQGDRCQQIWSQAKRVDAIKHEIVEHTVKFYLPVAGAAAPKTFVAGGGASATLTGATVPTVSTTGCGS